MKKIINLISNLFKKYSKVIGSVLAISISLLIFIFRNDLKELQTLGFLGLFFLSILGNATIILPVPVVLTAFIGGSIYNPFLVAIVISFGATIGELTGYLVGYGGGTLIKDSEKKKKIETWMGKYGIGALFVLAAIPNPLFDLAGVVAGGLKIPVWKYFLVVWAGKLIKFWLLAFIGANVLIK